VVGLREIVLRDEMLPRFTDKIVHDPATDCWNWTAYRGPGGYGRFSVDGPMRMAHRVSYTFFVGPVPGGKQIDHLCRNRGCVNPDHLEPVTNYENVVRGESGAKQAARTHCPQGHEYAGKNLIVNTNGARVCRECQNAAQRRQNAKKKEARGG
jgi:hypothetical protein